MALEEDPPNRRKVRCKSPAIGLSGYIEGRRMKTEWLDRKSLGVEGLRPRAARSYQVCLTAPDFDPRRVSAEPDVSFRKATLEEEREGHLLQLVTDIKSKGERGQWLGPEDGWAVMRSGEILG